MQFIQFQMWFDLASRSRYVSCTVWNQLGLSRQIYYIHIYSYRFFVPFNAKLTLHEKLYAHLLLLFFSVTTVKFLLYGLFSPSFSVSVFRFVLMLVGSCVNIYLYMSVYRKFVGVFGQHENLKLKSIRYSLECDCRFSGSEKVRVWKYRVGPMYTTNLTNDHHSVCCFFFSLLERLIYFCIKPQYSEWKVSFWFDFARIEMIKLIFGANAKNRLNLNLKVNKYSNSFQSNHHAIISRFLNAEKVDGTKTRPFIR